MSAEAVHVALDVSAIPIDPQGAGTYVLELAAALARRDDVALSCIARRDDPERWRAVAPRATVVALAPTHRLARLVYGELALAGALARLPVDPQVFHGPHYTLPARLELPAVVTVHDLTLVEHPEWHEAAKVYVFRRALRIAAARAAVVLCVSETTRDRFLAHYRPTGTVLVAPHGIDPVRFAPDEPSPGADAHQLAQFGVEGRYVLHLGTLEPRKNLPQLVRAFDRVAETQPGLRLVLAGRRGWANDELDQTIAHARHAAAITTLGYVEANAVPALLRRAAVVAYPSRDEGFGLPALEALACGAPVVTSAGTAMASLADGAALTVDPDDELALAGALEASLVGDAGASARRALGLARAAEATWTRSAEVHVRAYRLAAGQ